jgi:flagellar P-ring protein FlgI
MLQIPTNSSYETNCRLRVKPTSHEKEFELHKAGSFSARTYGSGLTTHFRSGTLVLLTLGLILSSLMVTSPVEATRIKDIAYVKGVRPNQLIGNGLVVGLNGTGDGTNVSVNVQELVNLLERMGVHSAASQIKVKNIASVVVTASLPPFARAGSRIDALVSSLGDAKSLQGGTLLLTPLMGVDGQVYAVAQGPMSIGGFSVSGNAGGGITKNHPTAGRVASGATVEREIPLDLGAQGEMVLALHDPDFTTANRVAQAINQKLHGSVAYPQDGGTIRVKMPPQYKGQVVGMMANLENLEISPSNVAKVIVDERNGTVIMGADVRVSSVAIAHGNLMINVKERQLVSQPQPFGQGETKVVPDTTVTVKEGGDRMMIMPEGISIGQVVQSLNAIGATPRDLITILQAIKAAGALQGELEII